MRKNRIGQRLATSAKITDAGGSRTSRRLAMAQSGGRETTGSSPSQEEKTEARPAVTARMPGRRLQDVGLWKPNVTAIPPTEATSHIGCTRLLAFTSGVIWGFGASTRRGRRASRRSNRPRTSSSRREIWPRTRAPRSQRLGCQPQRPTRSRPDSPPEHASRA